MTARPIDAAAARAALAFLGDMAGVDTRRVARVSRTEIGGPLTGSAPAVTASPRGGTAHLGVSSLNTAPALPWGRRLSGEVRR